MSSSYIKGSEFQNKFKNRMEKDIINDEEYMKFKEEETNTKKMSTILKSLNHTSQPKKSDNRLRLAKMAESSFRRDNSDL